MYALQKSGSLFTLLFTIFAVRSVFFQRLERALLLSKMAYVAYRRHYLV